MIVDCATLASFLPSKITRDSVLDALAKSLESDFEGSYSDIPVSAIVRLAYEDGRWFSCLDALDEVGVRDRQKLRQSLPMLGERGNQLLVTSRPSEVLRTDIAALGGCFVADVMRFSPGQVFSFARAWFANDSGHRASFETDLLDRPECEGSHGSRCWLRFFADFRPKAGRPSCCRRRR